MMVSLERGMEEELQLSRVFSVNAMGKARSSSTSVLIFLT
jgi:hypothetical protein